jgi:hypothetical protein
MKTRDQDAILQAAAKTLVWQLFAVAGYGRTRTPISVKRFDRELRTAVRQWNATHRNLKQRKEQQP